MMQMGYHVDKERDSNISESETVVKMAGLDGDPINFIRRKHHGSEK
jgi:hypothetical protein